MLGRSLVTLLLWLPRTVIYRVSAGLGLETVCRTCPSNNCRMSTCKRNALGLMFFMIFIPFLFYQLTFQVHYKFRHDNTATACFLPKLDPFDPTVMQFVWSPDPLQCDSRPSLLFVDTDGFVRFNSSALKIYGGKETDYHCTTSIIRRILDDDHIKYLPPVDLKPPAYIGSDFFKVSCKNAEMKPVYESILTSIDSNMTEKSKTIGTESPEHLSVIMFGIDSVSRSAAVRKMPKTFEYLTNELKMYDFKGYMTVGENTLPNLTPLLTGRRAWSDELPITDYSKEHFDPFPLIWKNFSRANYVTLFAEDSPEFSTFNYLTKGFFEQPTDHYMRPFHLAMKEDNNVESVLNPVFLFLENQKINVKKSSVLCHGDKAKHANHINYLKQFVTKYSRKRKFMFSFLSEIGHEYPNFLEYGDDDFLMFFKWLKANGHLENSALIVFSDHGARIDRIRNTFVGRIEEKMPLSMLYLPPHLRQKYPNMDRALKINSNRLSNPFDLHQTVGDILHGKFNHPSTQYFANRIRGTSLFKPLPVDRSCYDAWIPDHYCACYKSTPVNSTSDLVKSAADFVVRQMNKILTQEPKCAQLELYKIQESYRINHGLKHTNTENSGISIFQFFKPETIIPDRIFVVIETVPGHGVFDVTIDSKQGGLFDVVGDITRANRYGNQSNCISNKRLESKCYCK